MQVQGLVQHHINNHLLDIVDIVMTQVEAGEKDIESSLLAGQFMNLDTKALRAVRREHTKNFVSRNDHPRDYLTEPILLMFNKRLFCLDGNHRINQAIREERGLSCWVIEFKNGWEFDPSHYQVIG